MLTVRGYLDRIKCPTLLVTGEFDPLCPLEDAVEAYEDLKVAKEMWVFENQYHPLWGINNLGGMDCHDYVLDWLKGFFSCKRVPKKSGRIAYITCSLIDDENGARVRAFLAAHPEFAGLSVAEVVRLLPARADEFQSAVLATPEGLLMTSRRTATDGFFVAIMARR